MAATALFKIMRLARTVKGWFVRASPAGGVVLCTSLRSAPGRQHLGEICVACLAFGGAAGMV